MFNTKRKLLKWQEAGLLTEDQRLGIMAHEQQRHKNHFGRGLIGLSLLAIITGILSLIAANWEYIPGGVKIAVHFLLNITLAGVIIYASKTGRDLWRESALLVFFGLTLTLIGLIGQVFQLEGNLANATALWILITTPALFIFGRSKLTGIPWMLAFLVAIGLVFGEYVEKLPDFWAVFYGLSAVTLLPLALMADGNWRFFKKFNPAYATLFSRAGLVLLTLAASFFACFWYADWARDLTGLLRRSHMDYETGYLILAGIFAAAAASLSVHYLLHKGYRDSPDMRLGFIHAAVSIAFIALPVLLPTPPADMAGMVFFILYWIFIGWIAYKAEALRILSLSVTIIAIRILIIYGEAFGGLLRTGIGLIVSGLVMLLLIWGARKLILRLSTEMRND